LTRCLHKHYLSISNRFVIPIYEGGACTERNIEECSQSQASERFRSGVLAKKLGGEKASGSTGFVIAILLRNSSDTRAHFFSCIIYSIYIICDMPVAKLCEMEGRGTRRIFAKATNRNDSLHRIKLNAFFFFLNSINTIIIIYYNIYYSLLKNQKRRNKRTK